VATACGISGRRDRGAGLLLLLQGKDDLGYRKGDGLKAPLVHDVVSESMLDRRSGSGKQASAGWTVGMTRPKFSSERVTFRSAKGGHLIPYK